MHCDVELDYKGRKEQLTSCSGRTAKGLVCSRSGTEEFDGDGETSVDEVEVGNACPELEVSRIDTEFWRLMSENGSLELIPEEFRIVEVDVGDDPLILGLRDSIGVGSFADMVSVDCLIVANEASVDDTAHSLRTNQSDLSTSGEENNPGGKSSGSNERSIRPRIKCN
jgi:hypothetical protein